MPGIRSVTVSLAAAVLLVACLMPDSPHSDSIQFLVKTDKITLAWDPPASAGIGALAPTTYRVYYRGHNDSYWRFLDEVPASENPTYTVHHEDVGDGLWVFAVCSVRAAGGVSPLHTSLDGNADPFTGWHIFWVRTDR